MLDGVYKDAALFKFNSMQEGKRQKQISGLLQEELNTIFQKMGLNFVQGAMVSISAVRITPDLLEARIYLSVFNAKDNESIFNKVKDQAREIKKALAARVKNQLRRIPELKFFPDDTLDHVFRMEELFKQIKEEDGPQDQDPDQNQKPSS